MFPALKKRFWQEVSLCDQPGGHGVMLDARALTTPARTPLILPTRALAQAIADEWQAVTGKINPLSLPLTRAANAALDKVRAQMGPVADMLASYAETDLLCHRAPAPQGLVERQSAGWDPVLDWVATDLGAPLQVTTGILPISQPAPSLVRLRAAVGQYGPFGLTALHDMVTLCGSLVLGLAMARGRIAPDHGWALAQLDDEWQAEIWGADDEAKKAAQARLQGLETAAKLLALVGVDD